MWESVVKQYSGLVKFGRVNQDEQSCVVKRLPFASIYLPTVMTVGGNRQPEIL